MNTFYVYILTNNYHTVLYTGFTDDLYRRVYEHKIGLFPKSFTANYKVSKLVYYEEHNDMDEALTREKQLKRYKRDWKNNLINEMNPSWRDLYLDFEI